MSPSFFLDVPKGQAMIAGPFKARKRRATENRLMRPEIYLAPLFAMTWIERASLLRD